MDELIPLMTDAALVEEKDQLLAAHLHAIEDEVDPSTDRISAKDLAAVMAIVDGPVRDEDRFVDLIDDGYDRDEL
jgi:hypothetical protein